MQKTIEMRMAVTAVLWTGSKTAWWQICNNLAWNEELYTLRSDEPGEIYLVNKWDRVIIPKNRWVFVDDEGVFKWLTRDLATVLP